MDLVKRWFSHVSAFGNVAQLNTFNLAAVFLVLSGIASLTYQVVWVRLLGLSLGSTSASISTVLAAFFLGLALGSYLAERITRNRIENLHVYIFLEVVIGISGLLLLPILLNLDSYLATMPVLGAGIPMKFALTTLLLTVPTMCMGATFPVMASILIRRKDEVGLRVGQLYSLNTVGAVLGAALAGFVFVPNWGLDGAIYIAFSINLLIVVMAVYLNRHFSLPPIETVAASSNSEESDTSAISQQTPLRYRALMVLFATGMVSIATEVGWTKYLSIFTGTTIYGFAAILTIFLIGISAGSWVVKNHLNQMKRPDVWMSFGLVLLGSTLLLTRAGLTWIPPVYEALNHFPAAPWLRHGAKYTVVFLLLFPPTFVFGLLFPLNIKLYCGGLSGVRARIGKAYAVNTLASILGSLLAGFWIIPEYGTDVLLTSMAIIILVLPLFFVLGLGHRTLRLAVSSLVVVAIASNWLLPHLNYEDLISSVQYDDRAYAGKKPEYLYLKEGKTGVVSMVTYDGREVTLQNNGLNESFIDLEDENNVLLIEGLLGLVPYMLHPQPKSAFVIGFGGGITTRILTYTQLDSIRVVELEPAVVEAGRVIRGGTIPALADPRVTLTYNDARNTLLLENRKYDIIASQPSHPWLARGSNVFSEDFFKLVKSRLNQDGIYAQWVNLFHMDATTLKSLMKAFYQVFPYGMTFAKMDTGDFVMYGSLKPLVFDYAQIEQRLDDTRIRDMLNYKNIKNFKDLLWYFALSREQALLAAGDVPANTDLNILSEVRLSAIDQDPTGDEDPYAFLTSHYTFDVHPYFGGDVVDRMYELGTYYMVEWDQAKMAHFAADQLFELDPVRSRGIKYEKLWHHFNYKEAFSFYRKHGQWPDRTHVQQALALTDVGQNRQAMALVSRVTQPGLRRVLYARLLYEQKQFAKLLALQPKNDVERMWQLTALAKTRPLEAGKALVDVVQHVSPSLPQLRILAGYYGYQNETHKLDQVLRKIVKYQDKEISRVKKLMRAAIKDGKTVRARSLLSRIDALNPGVDYELGLMRSKIGNLTAAVAYSSYED